MCSTGDQSGKLANSICFQQYYSLFFEEFKLSFVVASVFLFSVHLLFLLLPLSLVSTLLCIFVEEVIYISLTVKHHQGIKLFSVSRLDALDCIGGLLQAQSRSLGIQFCRIKVCALIFKCCIFAKGGFQFGSIFCRLLLQLGKAGFCGCNILFDGRDPGIVRAEIGRAHV